MLLLRKAQKIAVLSPWEEGQGEGMFFSGSPNGYEVDVWGDFSFSTPSRMNNPHCSF